jgi:hypothetical protein
VNRLLRISPDEAVRWRSEVLRGRKDRTPGMVRVSLGLYNTREDIDRLVDMLRRVAADDFQGCYQADTKTGEFFPVGGGPDWARCFALSHHGAALPSSQ